jgi:cytochrome b involved in lipid metabolism
MPFLFRLARKSAGILVAAMIVSLFTGLMLVKYQLFPWISYTLIRDIHVFFILIVLIPVFYLHSLGGIMMYLNGKGLAKTKILKASVVTGWAAVFLVFGLVYSFAAPVPNVNTTVPQNSGIFAGSGSTGSSGVTLTTAELAAHGTADSCWVTIGGKVYDLTGFLAIHPGGTGAILPYCGKDGSSAFATKNTGSSHTPYATSLLDMFFIGDFGATVTGTPRPSVTAIPRPAGSLSSALSGAGGSPVTLSPAEISTHNSAGSCWMIVGGKVYDLTTFLSAHPAGPGAITPYCGKDGTTAFATQNRGSSHSSYADSLLTSYFIGDLGATVNVTPPPGAVNPPQVRGGEREGRDD